MIFVEENRVYDSELLAAAIDKLQNLNEDQDIFKRVIIPSDTMEVLLVKRSSIKDDINRKVNLFKHQSQSNNIKEM